MSAILHADHTTAPAYTGILNKSSRFKNIMRKVRRSSKHHNMMGKQRRKTRENSTGKANGNYRSVMTIS